MIQDADIGSAAGPPAWAARFHSDDLDEVREAVSRVDGEHSRVAHGTGRLGYDVAWLMGDVVSMAWARVALPTTLRGQLPNVVLHLGIPTGSRYRFGRREFQAGPYDALFVADGWEFTRYCPPGTSLALDVDKDALLREIAARSGGSPERLMLKTQRLRIDCAGRAGLLAGVASFVQATAPGAQVQAARHRAGDLLGAIAGLLVDQSAVVRVRQARNERISDLEGWVDAHLDQPITAGRLCQIAGVSQRGLEKIFESRRGMSPMRFVMERRLAAAQRMLRTADAGEEVTRVAIGLGFNHVGRFSALYRQAYGEAPSQTLQRARQVSLRTSAVSG